MTPDLLEQGEQRLKARQDKVLRGKTESGGRAAGFSHLVTSGEVDVTHGRILYLEDVTVSFDGFKAINNLSLDIAPGELRCIIGPNGAGKTTMFNLLTRFLSPTRGSIRFKDQDITTLRPDVVARRGLVRSFQISAVLPHLTVLDNVRVALQNKLGQLLPVLAFRELAAQTQRE